MRKIKLLLEYDGTAYHGWQIQPNGITVQEVLEKTLETITKKRGPVMGSGRTDSGVHAEGQVAHFETDSKMTPTQFLKAFNSLLPHDIAVTGVEEVPETFCARRSARGKIYRYTVLNRDYPSALSHGRCLFIQAPLNVEAMRRAKKYLVGKHDFSAFRASNCEAKHPVREIRRIDISRKGDFVEFVFEGNGFLKHMVRNIVGTLLEVGREKIKSAQVKAILESRDRGQAGPTAPGHGLTLVKVFYDNNSSGTQKSGKRKRQDQQD